MHASVVNWSVDMRLSTQLISLSLLSICYGQSEILVGLGRYAETSFETVHYPSGVGSGVTCPPPLNYPLLTEGAVGGVSDNGRIIVCGGRYFGVVFQLVNKDTEY